MSFKENWKYFVIGVMAILIVGVVFAADTIITDTGITADTLDTGQGANELYSMNQDVETTDAVTFATLDTGQGANELYSMNQDVETTDDVEFNSVKTNVLPVSVQNESSYITNLDTANIWLSNVMNKGGVSVEWQSYTNGSAHGQGDNAFSGGVLTPSGKVILVPRSSDNVGVYDTLNEISLGTALSPLLNKY